MGYKSFLALSQMMAIATSHGNYNRVLGLGGDKDYASNSCGKSQEELNIDKGLKQFTFRGKTVWAINQKNADKKFKKMGLLDTVNVLDAVCRNKICLDQYNDKCINGNAWKNCPNRKFKI